MTCSHLNFCASASWCRSFHPGEPSQESVASYVERQTLAQLRPFRAAVTATLQQDTHLS